jgi:FAD/FMN-containing dehydrogenase
MAEVSNWGNHPRIDARVRTFCRDREAAALLQEASPLIPRGLGRCYGDSALAPVILSTRDRRRILEVEGHPAGTGGGGVGGEVVTGREAEGTVVCEGGTSLGELLDVLVPRGWFLPVVPGTKHVTVGGAVASDIHGKNHHRHGTFSRHVRWLDLLTPDGSVRRLEGPARGGAEEEPDEGADRSGDRPPGNGAELFDATAGGMGLTGVVLRAALRLVPVETAFLRTETSVARDLEGIMGLFRDSAEWTYSVAWIDCQARGRALGRSVLFRGEHAAPDELEGERAETPLTLPAGGFPLNVPVHLPSWTLNALSVRVFNALYFRRQARKARRRTEALQDYESFFFPLDAVEHWNRIYGRRGFVQYQLVLPLEESERGLPGILERVAASGLGSFLAVLKLMGMGRAEGREMLSFPRQGFTLALDFPASSATFTLLEELDSLVLRHGGRLYLTKDARMPRHVLEEGYPDVGPFRALRRELDLRGTLASLQSSRLEL